MWQSLFGPDYQLIARSLLTRTGEECSWVPSKAVCACDLRVVKHSDHDIIGVSDCETSGCNDVKLSPADIEVLALKPSKVARALASAFGWDYREADTGIMNVRQIGTFGPHCWPIFFVIPAHQDELTTLARLLIGHFGGNFLLLVPTNRSVDGNAQSALRKANAGVVALEGLVTLAPDGAFQANRSAAELFGQLLPQSVERVVSVPVVPTVRYLFERAGGFWKVVFDGNREFALEDTLGAKYLNYLLHRPNLVISAFDLEVAVTPEKAAAREKNSIQRDLDPETMRRYLRELNKLRSLRDEAGDQRNYVEVERLDGEIEAIENALTKSDSPADTGERARGNVRKAIAAVKKKLLAGDKVQRAFGEHIEQFVDTGYECVYKQAEGRVWG